MVSTVSLGSVWKTLSNVSILLFLLTELASGTVSDTEGMRQWLIMLMLLGGNSWKELGIWLLWLVNSYGLFTIRKSPLHWFSLEREVFLAWTNYRPSQSQFWGNSPTNLFWVISKEKVKDLFQVQLFGEILYCNVVAGNFQNNPRFHLADIGWIQMHTEISNPYYYRMLSTMS